MTEVYNLYGGSMYRQDNKEVKPENSNNSNNLNNLNNSIKERISKIKINNDPNVRGFWFMWILVVILLLSTYITTPIRYSDEKVLHNLTYNRFYYVLYIVLLGLISYYGYKSHKKLALIRGEDLYLKIIPISVFIIGFFVINLFNDPVVKEDGSFSSAPNVTNKNKTGMIIHYVILILSVIALVAFDFMNSNNSLLGLQTYHIIGAIYGIIVLILCIQLLYYTTSYNVKKYNLPNTWRK